MVLQQKPLEVYLERVAQGGLEPDAAQEACIHALQTLYDSLILESKKPKRNLFHRMAGLGADDGDAPRGIYIHGGVGRGKSMLMDLFYGCLPDGIKKRRVHFHEFMIEVHDYVHSRQADDSVKGMVDQALPSLADLIARRAHVLCFDEFHVVDIADAMILGRLFRILFELGVVVVATSNWPPDRLYEGGIQRERFLPFINLLKGKVSVLHLESPHDYRTRAVQAEGTYFYPVTAQMRAKCDHLFAVLTDHAPPAQDEIEVKGRKITVMQAAKGVARFGFAQLCAQPLGAQDYLTIAQKYHTVFLEDIPKLSTAQRNEAKRFMNLIDALYEARARVIILAQVPAQEIYAQGDHAFEFERTVSRLMEMQSRDYP